MSKSRQRIINQHMQRRVIEVLVEHDLSPSEVQSARPWTRRRDVSDLEEMTQKAKGNQSKERHGGNMHRYVNKQTKN